MMEINRPADARVFTSDHSSSQESNLVEKKITPASRKPVSMFGDDGISFFDLLDIINPLQHIPIISTVYRNLTGDEIDPASKVAGGALYGGSIGTVVSLIDVLIEFSTGEDLGSHATTLTGTGNGGKVAALPREQAIPQSDGANITSISKNANRPFFPEENPASVLGLEKRSKHSDHGTHNLNLTKLSYSGKPDYTLEYRKNNKLEVAQIHQNNIHVLTKAHLIKTRALNGA